VAKKVRIVTGEAQAFELKPLRLLLFSEDKLDSLATGIPEMKLAGPYFFAFPLTSCTGRLNPKILLPAC
jgi:hypothetical protein